MSGDEQAQREDFHGYLELPAGGDSGSLSNWLFGTLVPCTASRSTGSVGTKTGLGEACVQISVAEGLTSVKGLRLAGIRSHVVMHSASGSTGVTECLDASLRELLRAVFGGKDGGCDPRTFMTDSNAWLPPLLRFQASEYTRHCGELEEAGHYRTARCRRRSKLGHQRENEIGDEGDAAEKPERGLRQQVDPATPGMLTQALTCLATMRAPFTLPPQRRRGLGSCSYRHLTTHERQTRKRTQRKDDCRGAEHRRASKGEFRRTQTNQLTVRIAAGDAQHTTH